MHQIRENVPFLSTGFILSESGLHLGTGQKEKAMAIIHFIWL